MGIGKALAAKVRHRVGLAPDHIVQDPETGILQRSTHTEDVVIAANNPDRAIGFQQATGRFLTTCVGKFIIDLKAGKLVPFIVNRVYLGIVGAHQIATQLQVIRRVRKDQVNLLCRKRIHRLDTVAIKDRVQWKHRGAFFNRLHQFLLASLGPRHILCSFVEIP